MSFHVVAVTIVFGIDASGQHYVNSIENAIICAVRVSCIRLKVTVAHGVLRVPRCQQRTRACHFASPFLKFHEMCIPKNREKSESCKKM